MIVYNNETIKNAIMDALDKMERGIEINEVDRNELINVILKYGDRDFGIKNGNRKCTEEELQYSVYIHINNKNNKCYVGQTSVNPKERWGSNGTGYIGQIFYNAIKKYGWNNISHIILCHRLNKEQADNMEILLISILKSKTGNFGYNVANGGNTIGKHSKETRNKMSENRKGKCTGENNPMYSKHPSQETKEKQREVKKGENNPMYGKQHSEITIEKMREKKKGENNPFYGKQHSKETIEKMRENRKGENSPVAKKVYCNEKIFTTAKECAKFYNVATSTMSKWLNGDYKKPSKLLSEFIELGLRFATEEDINTYPLYIKQDQ